jgi:uncharacterized protein (DUF58 family)
MSVASPSSSSEPSSRHPWHIANWQIPEVWLRFLLALVGLVLAFAAALFSTVSRDSGNIWATLILASAALLLATIVGVTTVPYLARRVVAARIREVFHYDVTRAGIVYIGITVLIGIAALNTGNNLLYIVVAALLAAILISGLASAVVLRGLHLDVRLPEHVFAGKPVLGRILVRNTRTALPAFSIRVVPSKTKPKRWMWEPYTFVVPSQRPGRKQWLRLPDRRFRRVTHVTKKARIFEDSAYFPFITAQREMAADLELRFEHRGRYEEDSFGLATRFPFAFLTKTRFLPLSREVIVYPPVQPTDAFFEVLPLITGEFESFVRGRGNDLYRIREYLPDDSARYVDWKASAKSGSLKVREFSREDERKLRIVFDNPQPGIAADTYEKAIELAASLAWYFAGRDTDISFLTPEYQGTNVYHFLRYLALAQPKLGRSVLDHLTHSDDYNVILTTRPHGTIPTALWNCSYLLFIDQPR